MKFIPEAIIFVALHLVILTETVAASAFEATSTAKIEQVKSGNETRNKTTTVNTRFVFDESSKQQEEKLYKVTLTDVRVYGENGSGGSIKIEAFDASSKKPIWMVTDSGDEWRLVSRYFVMTTEKHGCCGSQNSYRAISTTNGKQLFPYSFKTSNGLPVILRAGAFEPEMFRFIAYQDASWPVRDRGEESKGKGNLILEGILTYSSPTRVIDRIGIYSVKAVNNEAGGNPGRITVATPDRSWTFTEKRDDTEVEADSEPIFDRISISLIWDHTGDTLTVPLVKDRLGKAELKGKLFSRVSPLPVDGWKIQGAQE